MHPFQRHPANPGELERYGRELLDRAAEASDQHATTQGAYQPAVAGWQGMGATQLRAAPRPLRTEADEAGRALGWAGLVCEYWAERVRSFNAEVDQITSTAPYYGATGVAGEPPTAEAIAAARHAAEQRWHRAHERYIRTGGDTVESMLADGPTDRHLSELGEVGLLPSIGSQFAPGWGREWYEYALFGAGWGANAAAAGSELLTLRWQRWYKPHWTQLRNSRWARPQTPPGFGTRSRIYTRAYLQPHWNGWRGPSLGNQHTSHNGYRYSRLGRQNKPNLDAGQRTNLGRAQTASRWASRGGAALAVGTAAVDQWMSDTGRSDLSGGEKAVRAATRGVTVGGAAWGGAKTGAVVGSMIGSVVPGVGTGVGAVVGGVIGGIAGAAIATGAAETVVDGVVDGAGKAAKAVGNFVGGLFGG